MVRTTIKSRLGGMFGIGFVDFRSDLAQFSTVVQVYDIFYTAISLQGSNHFLGSDKTWGYLRISCQKTKYQSIQGIWRSSCENWSADNLGTENDITTDCHLIPGTDILIFLQNRKKEKSIYDYPR